MCFFLKKHIQINVISQILKHIRQDFKIVRQIARVLVSKTPKYEPICLQWVIKLKPNHNRLAYLFSRT